MLIVEVLKSFAIGVCASAPIGPVALLVMQKTLSYGRRPGWMVGCGCATVDTFSAIITILTFGIFATFIDRNFAYFQSVGGLVLLVIGLSMLLRNPFRRITGTGRNSAALSAKYYFQGFLTASTNPAGLLFMMAITAFWKLDPNPGRGLALLDILFIFVGAVSYWFVFSSLVNLFRARLKVGVLVVVNRLAGAGVMMFGGFLIYKGLNSLII